MRNKLAIQILIDVKNLHSGYPTPGIIKKIHLSRELNKYNKLRWVKAPNHS